MLTSSAVLESNLVLRRGSGASLCMSVNLALRNLDRQRTGVYPRMQMQMRLVETHNCSFCKHSGSLGCSFCYCRLLFAIASERAATCGNTQLFLLQMFWILWRHAIDPSSNAYEIKHSRIYVSLFLLASMSSAMQGSTF